MTKYFGHIVDPINEQIFDGCISITDNHISNVEKCKISSEDESNYILPGFIDSHIHIESTLMTPSNFAKVASRHGTICVVTDPHEIANVSGFKGIEYMLHNARQSNFHFAFCVPSCVPELKDTDRYYTSETIKSLLNREEFYGLSEMMNFFGVINEDKSLTDIIDYTLQIKKVVDGHVPILTGKDLRKYIDAGINTDHETISLDNAIEKLSLGMSIQIREGSAARNFQNLFPLLLEGQYKGKIMFCTDDIYPDELLTGHINKLVAKSISLGAPLWNVLNAACVTPRVHYKLKTGLLQKGDNADFIIVDNLKDFNVKKTIINGKESYSTIEDDHNYPNSFNAETISEEDIYVYPTSDSIKVIVAQDGLLVTERLDCKPNVINGRVSCDIDNDILKLVVLDRYKKAKPAVGFIQGFGLKKGAIASSIAHDSHNLIAVGTNDKDIVNAINSLINAKGGINTSFNDSIEQLNLPVAGLMSTLSAEETANGYKRVRESSKLLGCKMEAPYMTLSFMSLHVIPSLKLTENGLFDVNNFQFTTLFN